MQYPLVRAALLGLALVCGGANAHETLARFDFPTGHGSLQLWTERCANATIVRLYEGDVPEPFLSGVLSIRGRVLTGCWYAADSRVFFTDSEGDLLVPPPQIDQFSSAENSLQRLVREGGLHTHVR